MPSLKRHEGDEVALTITTVTFVRLALMTVITIVLLAAARRASHALLLIFIAFFLALALNAPVYWVTHHLPGRLKGSRSFGTALSFLIVILLLGGFLASIVPPLVRQTGTFIDAAPGLIDSFKNQDSGAGKLVRTYHLENQVNEFSDQLGQRLSHAGGNALSGIQKIGSSIFALLTILVLTFMMLVEGPRWLELAREILPERHHGLAKRLASDMYLVVKGYVNGQVTLAALAALLIAPALFILHVSYPVALMVIVFICGLIPMVGHTLGAIIVTTIALFHSVSAALIILGYYILYQQMENYLLQPRIQANSTNMSPLLVFMSVIIGVSFGGLIGGLVAIPLAGCLRIAVLEYLRSRRILSTPEFNTVTGTDNSELTKATLETK